MRYSSLKTKKTPNRTVTGLWAGLTGLVRATVISLEYTQPKGLALVYRFDIHRKSLRTEEYIWKLWILNVSSVKNYIK